MAKKILIVAAHPDDEVLGCGATTAGFATEGHDVFTLILGEGITSRDEVREPKRREEEIRILKGQVEEANQILGVKEVFLHDFPDNRFDSVSLLDIVKVIVLVDREEGGKEKILEHVSEVEAVCTKSELLEAYKRENTA